MRGREFLMKDAYSFHIDKALVIPEDARGLLPPSLVWV